MGVDESRDCPHGDLKGLLMASDPFVKQDVKPVTEEGGTGQSHK